MSHHLPLTSTQICPVAIQPPKRSVGLDSSSLDLCLLRELLQVLQSACIYDINEIPRSNCCANEKGEKRPCEQQSTNFIRCHQAA